MVFKSIKNIYVDDTNLHYLDFNKFFDIHTDSSEYQMRAIVSQNGRPVIYWSKNLTDTQKKYPITDQDLLVIVDCLKQYKMYY